MFRIDNDKAAKILTRRELSIQSIADAMQIPMCDMAAMLKGDLQLDIDECRKLMSILGFGDFVDMAASEEVREYARRIAYKG